MLPQKDRLEIKVDANIFSNHVKRYIQKGNKYPKMTTDVVVEFVTLKCPNYQIKNYNLIKKCVLSLKEALTIKSLTISNIDSQEHLIVIDEIIDDKKVIKVAN